MQFCFREGFNARPSCCTYTLWVVGVASKPHGHFGARSFHVVSLHVTLFVLLLLYLLFLHYDSRGRRLGVVRAPIVLSQLGLQWFRLDWVFCGWRGGVVFDGKCLRKFV